MICKNGYESKNQNECPGNKHRRDVIIFAFDCLLALQDYKKKGAVSLKQKTFHVGVISNEISSKFVMSEN